MKLFLFVALAAVIAVGCAKNEETLTPASPPSPSTVAKGPTAPAKPGSAPAVSGGKFAAAQAVFTKNCLPCHGDSNPKAGITLTSYEGVMKGGREGVIIKAGDPDGSKLDMALHGKGAKQMPPKGALPAADIATIESWIKDGAKK
jgi:mono/diheme cytochrome c family protein